MLNKLNSPKTCLFVQCTQPVRRYLLVERALPFPRILAAGSFDADDSGSLAEQLQEQLATHKVRCRQAVLLLPRSALEVASHQLPPAKKDELPELVYNAAASECDEAAGAQVSDFLVTHQDDTGCETLVFSLPDQRINDFVSSFKTAGMKLLGITFSGLGSVQLIKQVIQHPASTAVTVAIGDADVDLAVTENGRAVMFRSIPYSSEEDRVRAERVGTEIRRTLALAHHAADEPTRLYLIGDVDTHEQLAQLLAEQLSASASVVNPLNHVKVATDIESPSRYANLIGMACAWNGEGLELNFLNPRRPPRKASPWRRAAFWGAIAATVLVGIGYVAWKDRSDELAAIAERKQDLKQLAGRANKALELQDIADAVNAWRSDDIAWLDELRELSERLPGGEQALIRRMSMSTDSAGNGVIDLAVQVSRPEVVANLEDAIRDERHSVSSKRVTESDEKAKLPWAFETRIAFQPADLPELPSPDEIAQEDNESAAVPDQQARVALDTEQEGAP